MPKAVTVSVLDQKLTDFITEARGYFTSIKEQTTKTNGKVADLVEWRSMIKGVWTAIVIFAAVLSTVVPIIVSVYFSNKNDEEMIQKMIDKTISNYIEKE